MAVVGVESILYTSFIVNCELILCIRKTEVKFVYVASTSARHVSDSIED